MPSAREVLSTLEQRLQAGGIMSARVEAEWLLADLLGTNRTELYVLERPLDSPLIGVALQTVERRVAGEPLQHVTGIAEFCGIRLRVNPHVFIPRPETEALVERAIDHLRHLTTHRADVLRVLDLATGSGSIAIALASFLPACHVTAVELSWDALQTAALNVSLSGVGDRVSLVQGDWTAAVQGPFDFVISNPPYVPWDQVERIRVRRPFGDPVMSLDGGPDGMRFHRLLITELPRLLHPGESACVECAEDQTASLYALAMDAPGVRSVEILDDLAGRPRGIWIDTRG